MMRWQTVGYQKRWFDFAGFVEVEIVEIVGMDGLGQTVVGFVGPPYKKSNTEMIRFVYVFIFGKNVPIPYRKRTISS